MMKQLPPTVNKKTAKAMEKMLVDYRPTEFAEWVNTSSAAVNILMPPEYLDAQTNEQIMAMGILIGMCWIMHVATRAVGLLMEEMQEVDQPHGPV